MFTNTEEFLPEYPDAMRKYVYFEEKKRRERLEEQCAKCADECAKGRDALCDEGPDDRCYPLFHAARARLGLHR
jgi:hypothetical protein